MKEKLQDQICISLFSFFFGLFGWKISSFILSAMGSATKVLESPVGVPSHCCVTCSAAVVVPLHSSGCTFFFFLRLKRKKKTEGLTARRVEVVEVPRQ